MTILEFLIFLVYIFGSFATTIAMIVLILNWRNNKILLRDIPIIVFISVLSWVGFFNIIAAFVIVHMSNVDPEFTKKVIDSSGLLKKE